MKGTHLTREKVGEKREKNREKGIREREELEKLYIGGDKEIKIRETKRQI